jgi:hypothetical protein
MDDVKTLREQFNDCGLTLEKEIDITSNVLTALRLDNARKLELIDALIPRMLHRPFRASSVLMYSIEHGRAGDPARVPR